ncbi:unnamed protein product [Acanthoscelides obtectus]|uniref:Uncharacterized protein n=1 Tax=Acanthoscelides obtectus TaxID=200917 RepID=A0A9P0NY86_ACAOB|nr:unnamed protein product [Acanthoscelides obtectus]CAK1633800.1 hypothetical protein AOBTE_LOCUS8398 [Acanthoscelides obtectus]
MSFPSRLAKFSTSLFSNLAEFSERSPQFSKSFPARLAQFSTTLFSNLVERICSIKPISPAPVKMKMSGSSPSLISA